MKVSLARVASAVLLLVGRSYAAQRFASADAALEAAEDEELASMGATRAAINAEGSVIDDADVTWAGAMTELTLGADGVDDERLPTIAVGATEAELPEASNNALAVLSRKQKMAGSGLRVDVLESQLVVISGMESKADRAARAARGIEGVENVRASELACRSINGTALFLLAHRYAVEDAPHRHELAFFDAALWHQFTEYMRAAREQASFFRHDGGGAAWATRIHWNVMPSSARAPFVLRRSEMRVVATPTLRVAHQHAG